MSGLLPGIGSHHSARSQTDEWCTPQFILDRLGRFDLDPCATVEHPTRCATAGYTIADDGLSKPWTGRVWLNPPYSRVGVFLNRLAAHGQGTALVFARTETQWWFSEVWAQASAILFLRGRLTFVRPDGAHPRADGGVQGGGGNSGAPSALIAYGPADVHFLERAPISGAFIKYWRH